jgi:hypothetical protein
MRPPHSLSDTSASRPCLLLPYGPYRHPVSAVLQKRTFLDSASRLLLWGGLLTTGLYAKALWDYTSHKDEVPITGRRRFMLKSEVLSPRREKEREEGRRGNHRAFVKDPSRVGADQILPPSDPRAQKVKGIFDQIKWAGGTQSSERVEVYVATSKCLFFPFSFLF